MSQVYVQTEECYQESERQNRALFPFFPMGPDVEFIAPDQLVDVLNSAVKDGTERHYVVRES